MHLYLYVRTLTFFHIPGPPPSHGLKEEVPLLILLKRTSSQHVLFKPFRAKGLAMGSPSPEGMDFIVESLRPMVEGSQTCWSVILRPLVVNFPRWSPCPPGRGYLLVAGIDPIQISPDGINPECHRLFFENSGEAPVDEGVGSFDCMSFNNGAGGANQCLLW